MLYIFGIIIALGSLFASIVHLGQDPTSYYDFVGIVMVVGGTTATAIISMPWDINTQIIRSLKEVLSRPFSDRKKLLVDCLAVIQEVLKGVYHPPEAHGKLHQKILRDGIELIQLGFNTQKIEAILQERLYQGTDRARHVGSAIRSLAKYPPAFGLAGTVLGLVHLMRGVSDGMSPQETGVRMAIALIATFYGLLVANLIVNPIGDAVYKNANDDEKMAEVALQAILLASDRVNLLESQEMLNSFVDEKDRVDVIGLQSPSSVTSDKDVVEPPTVLAG